MSDVQFEENNFSGADRFAAASNQSPMLVKLLLKTGLVKDEKRANYVLIGIAVCAVLLTLFVIHSSFGGGSPNRNILPPSAFPAPVGVQP